MPALQPCVDGNVIIIWNTKIVLDRPAEHNKPDMLMKVRSEKMGHFIDFAVSTTTSDLQLKLDDFLLLFCVSSMGTMQKPPRWCPWILIAKVISSHSCRLIAESTTTFPQSTLEGKTR